jgi:hypothetical protein
VPTIRQVVGRSGPETRPLAVALAAHSGALSPAKAGSAPVYPAIIWMDGRTEDLVKKWRTEGVEKKDFEDWRTYDNTEFRADENFTESWADVDKLKTQFKKEVYLITINSDSSDSQPAVRKESEEEKRYTFAFDYAVTEIDDDSLKWIEYFIQKHRNNKIDDPRTKIPWNARTMIYLSLVSCVIEKFPFIESHFT